MPIIRKKKSISIDTDDYIGPVSDEELLEDGSLTPDQRIMIMKTQQGFRDNTWLYEAFVPFDKLCKEWHLTHAELLEICLSNNIPVHAPVNERAISYQVIDFGTDHKYSKTGIEYPPKTVHQLDERDLEKLLSLATGKKYKLGKISISIGGVQPRNTDFTSPNYPEPVIVRLANEAQVRFQDLGLHGDDVCLMINDQMFEQWREKKNQLRMAEYEELTLDNPETRNEFLLRLGCGYLWSLKEIMKPPAPSNHKIAANIVKAMDIYHGKFKGKHKLTINHEPLKPDSIVRYIGKELKTIKDDYADKCKRLKCNSSNPDDTELDARKYEMNKIMNNLISKMYGKNHKPKLVNHEWDFFDPDNYVDVDAPKKM